MDEDCKNGGQETRYRESEMRIGTVVKIDSTGWWVQHADPTQSFIVDHILGGEVAEEYLE